MIDSLVDHRAARARSRAQPRARAERTRRIYIGEVVASATPLVLQTLLGSCVAVCLWDPGRGVGGMNHILLPGRSSGGELPSRFGVHAMELLINAVTGKGGNRRRFLAKAFGAGNVVSTLKSPTVGDRNAIFVRDFLAAERIPLVAQRLGGNCAVQVQFSTHTGKTTVYTVNGSRLPSILNDENAYSRSLAQADGEVTLF